MIKSVIVIVISEHCGAGRSSFIKGGKVNKTEKMD